MRPQPALLGVLVLLVACGGEGEQHGTGAGEAGDPPAAEQAPARVYSIEGLSGPEAVRYDADQDVWFVSNFGPGSEDRDADGFLSRVDAGSGAMVALRFAVGTAEHPLHMPRGMALKADTLWVADVDGIHGFDRQSGAHLAFVDFTSHAPGFLNDIAVTPDGTLYVTDTGRSALYRVDGGRAVEVWQDPAAGAPNGITWDGERRTFVLAPWEPGNPVHLWAPGEAAPVALGEPTPGRLDGVERTGVGLLFASQTDSTVQILGADGRRTVLMRVAGAPADLGVDTRRNRLAVPFIGLDRVDIWALPDG